MTIVGVAEVVVTLRGLLLMPVIAKMLGPTGYGTWAQVFVTLTLISPLCGLGTNEAFMRFFAGVRDKQQIREGFFSIVTIVMGWSVVVAAALLLFAGHVAGLLFKGADAVEIVMLIAIILPLMPLHFLLISYFVTFRQIRAYSALMVSANMAEVMLVASFVIAGLGVFGAVLAILVTRTLFVGIMFYMVVSQIGIALPSRKALRKVKAYLHYGMPLLFPVFFSWIVVSSDRYVIAIFLGIGATGVYSAAYNLAQIPRIFSRTVGVVLLPTVSALYDQGKPNEVGAHLSYSLKLILLVLLPAAVGLSVLSGPSLRILTTPSFAEGSLVVPFVALSIVLWSWYSIMLQPIRLAKRTAALIWIWSSAALANLVLNLLFVPRLGIEGAAMASVVAYTIAAGLTTHVSFKCLRFGIDYTFILRSLVACAVMAGVVHALHPERALGLLLSIVLGAGVYFMTLFLLGGLRKGEIEFFRQLLPGLNPFRKAERPVTLATDSNGDTEQGVA